MDSKYKEDLTSRFLNFEKKRIWNFEFLLESVNEKKFKSIYTECQGACGEELHRYYMENSIKQVSLDTMKDNWRDWTNPQDKRLPDRQYAITISFMLEFTYKECNKLLGLLGHLPLVIRNIQDAVYIIAFNQHWVYKDAIKCFRILSK